MGANRLRENPWYTTDCTDMLLKLRLLGSKSLGSNILYRRRGSGISVGCLTDAPYNELNICSPWKEVGQVICLLGAYSFNTLRLALAFFVSLLWQLSNNDWWYKIILLDLMLVPEKFLQLPCTSHCFWFCGWPLLTWWRQAAGLPWPWPEPGSGRWQQRPEVPGGSRRRAARREEEPSRSPPSAEEKPTPAAAAGREVSVKVIRGWRRSDEEYINDKIFGYLLLIW